MVVISEPEIDAVPPLLPLTAEPPAAPPPFTVTV
jgi:hypothetical protein